MVPPGSPPVRDPSSSSVVGGKGSPLRGSGSLGERRRIGAAAGLDHGVGFVQGEEPGSRLGHPEIEADGEHDQHGLSAAAPHAGGRL